MAEQDELHAALEARKELGPEYEPQVVDSFLERIERRLDERRDSLGTPHPHPSVTPLALGSIGAGVGATAVATGMGTGGIVVAIVAWIAIAIVNVAYAWRRR